MTILLLALLCGCGEERRDDDAWPGVLPAIPPGSVPREGVGARVDAALSGQEGYAIYCAPCHGKRGAGDGAMTRHGLLPPESFAELPPGALAPERTVRIIAEGYGRMQPQGQQVGLQMRWAIARHVATLARNREP